jgi:hypothetical protein
MKEFCSKCNQEIFETRIQKQEIQNFLKISFYKNLCRDCENEITELLAKAKSIPFPKTYLEFIENTHYYLEKGKFVFTEIYHLQKNYCCQNSCRHCPYGFKKQVN